MNDASALADKVLLLAVLWSSTEYLVLYLRNGSFPLLQGDLFEPKIGSGPLRANRFASAIVVSALISRAMLAILLVIFSSIELAVVGFLLLALLGVVVAVYLPYGTEGSDQLALFLCFASGLNRLFYDQVTEGLLVEHFVVAQLTICYVTSGISKMRSKAWRDGTGLSGIMFTHIYGSPRAFGFLGLKPWMWRIAAWSVMIVEVAFLLVLVLPHNWALGILAMLGIFHWLTALFMGLFGFFLTFSAGILYVVAYLNVVN